MQSSTIHGTATIDPNHISVVYKQQLSDSARCLPKLGSVFGGFLCDVICWDKLKPRSYVAVHENRVESNYPYTCCCGLWIEDYVTVEYFDNRSKDTMYAHATSCTPYHFCYCIELCGGVATIAPCNAVNNCCCGCCRFYYPGLQDPQGFVQMANKAKQAFYAGQRLQSVQVVTVTTHQPAAPMYTGMQ